jgi:hypothetical protein
MDELVGSVTAWNFFMNYYQILREDSIKKIDHKENNFGGVMWFSLPHGRLSVMMNLHLFV